jgi:transposase-like protein
VGGQRKRSGSKDRHRASGLPNLIKVRCRWHVYPKALVIAYSVHETGRREVIGLDIGETETEAFWVEFLRSLRARGLTGVRLCVSDQHQGLKNAIARVLGCRWQRCTVHCADAPVLPTNFTKSLQIAGLAA